MIIIIDPHTILAKYIHSSCSVLFRSFTLRMSVMQYESHDITVTSQENSLKISPVIFLTLEKFIY